MISLGKAIERHEKSKSHIVATMKLKVFGKVRTDQALSQAATLDVQQHNSQNCDYFRELLDNHAVSHVQRAVL